MYFETERLIIRGPELRDAGDIYRNYTRDADVTKYMTWKPHVDISQTEAWIKYCIQDADTADSIKQIIFQKEDSQAIGMVDFAINGHMAELGYVLTKRYWNRGLMTEAVRPVLEYVLSIPSVYRVWAVHDVDNPASGRVMQKLGLVREGVLKRFCLHPNISDEPRDAVLYAITK